MDWGIELWDQFDKVGAHTQRGIEFCEKFAHFLKERSAVEQEYVRNMKKLVKSFHPKKKEEDDEHEFSCTSAFLVMLKEIQDAASQHECVAQSIQGSVCLTLQNLISQLKQNRKKHLQEGYKLQEQMKLNSVYLDRAKAKYEKSYRESEKALDSYRKYEADQNLSRAEVEKQRVVMNQKLLIFEDSKLDYASILSNYNANQQQHYNSLMPEVFKNLQNLEETRLDQVQKCMAMCADIEKEVLPIFDICVDGITHASEGISFSKVARGDRAKIQVDCQQVVEQLKSGFQIPTDMPFEDLSVCGTEHRANSENGSMSVPAGTTKNRQTFSAKTKKRGGIFAIFAAARGAECKENFSYLPPNQRSRKLRQKVNAIKKTLAKECSEREGMLKLKDVYTSNPALGDPDLLERKVEENSHMVEAIRLELKKYEGYLEECEVGRRQSCSGDSLHSSDSSLPCPNSQQLSRETPSEEHNVYV